MNITFEQACKDYLNFIILKRKPQSYRAISSRVNLYIRPYFNNKLINNLTTTDYLNWQTTINSKGLSFHYKESLHYAMVSMLNFCIKFYGLEENIASKVGNFQNNYDYKDLTFWTINEFNKFINSVDDIIYKTLFNFLFFTGCRIGESLALNFNDLIDNTIKINKTISKELYNGKRAITLPKTKKSIRNILIDNKLKNEINELRAHYITKYGYFNNNFYIFGGIKPLSNTTIERKKNKWCELSNVPKIRIHDFRHSHATLLISSNIPITAISNRLGHSNTSTTLDVYSHFVKEDEKRVINTLNSIRIN